MVDSTRYRIVHVSSRMRTLGYGDYTTPFVVGTPRQIQTAHAEELVVLGIAANTHSLFVDGCRIVSNTDDLVDALLQPNADFTVVVEDERATDDEHAAALEHLQRERDERAAAQERLQRERDERTALERLQWERDKQARQQREHRMRTASAMTGSAQTMSGVDRALARIEALAEAARARRAMSDLVRIRVTARDDDGDFVTVMDIEGERWQVMRDILLEAILERDPWPERFLDDSNESLDDAFWLILDVLAEAALTEGTIKAERLYRPRPR